MRLFNELLDINWNFLETFADVNLTFNVFYDVLYILLRRSVSLEFVRERKIR